MKLHPRCGNGATSLESCGYTYRTLVQGPKKWFATKGGPRQEQAIFSGSLHIFWQHRLRYVKASQYSNTSIQSPTHRFPDYFLSEDFLAELEAKLAALCPQYLGHRRVAAVEHRDLALVLLLQRVEHLVPVGPAGLRPRLQPGHEISLFLGVFKFKFARLCFCKRLHDIILAARRS